MKRTVETVKLTVIRGRIESMSTQTITEFLEARIAEDEERARVAAPWATGSRHEGQPIDWSIHFDAWSPARVLAECAAKRAIVELVRPYLVYQSTSDTSREFLQVLAAVYKDHPDYQQEWVK